MTDGTQYKITVVDSDGPHFAAFLNCTSPGPVMVCDRLPGVDMNGRHWLVCLAEADSWELDACKFAPSLHSAMLEAVALKKLIAEHSPVEIAYLGAENERALALAAELAECVVAPAPALVH